MDWAQQQQGVSLPAPRSQLHAPRMQYQHGGSRSRMPPFPRGGGGAYNRGQKQFYPPPPPAPPLPATVLPPPPPPLSKYEVLMEAGRLAAEYLVAKGVLPPASLQQRGGAVGAGGWGQLPPPPPLSAGLEALAYYNARNGRRQVDDECSTRNARSRRNRGGDYSSGNSSNYNGRGKRKFGADNRYSDLGRDRGRKGYSDTRSYDEDDEDGAPGFKRERRSSGGIDEVGSSVSGVAGEGPSSKAEAMGESELEDTGSKASSNSNVQQKDDAPQEVEDENEANKMQEDSVVSNSEVVEQTLNCEGNSNNDSSAIVQKEETIHLPASSGEKVSEERPEDSGIQNEKVEGDTALAEDDMESDEVSIMENNLPNDSINLLNYCSFARVPTRPRSVLANRNARPAQREFGVPEQVNLVPTEEVSQTAVDEEANANSITSIQEDSKDNLVRQEHAEPSTTCNHVAESVTFHGKGTQGETEEMEEQSEDKNIAQHCGLEDNKEPNELSPAFTSRQNNFTLQVEKGIQIYNLDTPPQDEVLIDPPDKGKTVDSELLPNIKAEIAVTEEEEKLGQSSSFKIRDLNLVGSPEVADMRADPRLGQSSTAGCSVELQHNQQVDFGATNGNNSINTDTFLLGNKAVQVIDIEDDPPIEADACDTSKAKGEMVYSNMGNMMNPPTNTDALHGIQDGYTLAISDYLGADMPCYQSIQTDLQAGMDLNGSEGITVMDDSIYGSLGDIGNFSASSLVFLQLRAL
ncbi:hypothetical protein HU200_009340 [Digitaria exilis]|uniref:Uncharacterized protein n=1 Tax=Digitaria exilis TaxID=1010633 RepID=A0A835FK13_9POAL|nr:hypothetical protein HU200_009340 [Digitaria exilis]